MATSNNDNNSMRVKDKMYHNNALRRITLVCMIRSTMHLHRWDNYLTSRGIWPYRLRVFPVDVIYRSSLIRDLPI